jgi:hypothetical protein
MSNSKVSGAILLAAGTGLLVWGFQLYDAVGNQLSRALGGATSNEAVVALVAGAICIGLGALMLFKK